MLLYNIVVVLYGLVIKLASIKDPKAKLWVKGRQHWRSVLALKMKPYTHKKKVWVHCASLGEFEQGRPLIEAIRTKYPDYCIVLTFFSPSGYEVRKNYDKADVICYLPLDTKANAIDFLKLVDPSLIIFIKYEFWVNYLNQINQFNIKAYLVSAVFKDHHPFFKWYGGIFIRSLKAFDKLFVQDKNSLELLKTIGFKNVNIVGDTRFDRVLDVKKESDPVPEVATFKARNKLLIAGSTWPKDDELVIETFKALKDGNTKLLIAPHEIGEGFINDLIKKLQKNDLSYSVFSDGIRQESDVLILNTMGMLSRVYYYADLSYIGGGFDDGIHNILEPAVYGCPVVFGGTADHQKFNEAVDLLALGCCFKIQVPNELTQLWNAFNGQNIEKDKVKTKLEAYFKSNSDVTTKLMSSMDFV